MSSYASFRKCDFQVHSPRDPQWKGVRPPSVNERNPETQKNYTEEEVDKARDEWADKFIDACVERGLRAVALTDHHEMVMASYVKKALSLREIIDGPDLWFFPGMELTLKNGTQCLIIFDAELPEDVWNDVQGALKIERSAIDFYASKSKDVSPLYNIEYTEIPNELSDIKAVQGRYIVLPNVSGKNDHHVLRRGMHETFKNMPYIGGYLDQGLNIENIDSAVKNKLLGKADAWGDRIIYPLPTSDSRKDSFDELGSNNAWIKLSEPTAESIRQAFLAWESRIKIEEPISPAIVIKKLNVTGAHPLSDTEMVFSSELNSLIGGRGSGKSTFLEYVAFGMGRSCYDRDPVHGLECYQRLKSLIQDTIIKRNATIELTLSHDGAEFVIQRSPENSYEPVITDNSGTSDSISTKQLRDQFPAFAYSQGELAEIGKKRQDGDSDYKALLKFVKSHNREEVKNVDERLSEAKSAIAEAFQKLINHWENKNKKNSLEVEISSLKSRITALKKQLPKLTEEEEKILREFERLNQLDVDAEPAINFIDRLMESINEAAGHFNDDSGLPTIKTDEETNGQYKTFADSYKNLVRKVGAQASSLIKTAREQKVVMDAAYEEWRNQLDKITESRNAIMEKKGVQKELTQNIQRLETQISDKQKELSKIDYTVQQGVECKSKFDKARENLAHFLNYHIESINGWCSRIENLSNHKIAIHIEEDYDRTEIFQALDTLSAGTRSQESRRKQKFNEMVNSGRAYETLNTLCNEIVSIFEWKILGSEETGGKTPEYPNLSNIIGDSGAIIESLLDYMDVDRATPLLKAVPQPKISFKYKTAGNNEIDFDKASEGQRSSILLSMLLNQDGGPLVIDQPENDLDNEIISEITEKLHHAKTKRQILFATHNANIVVNGSSELVIHMNSANDGKRVIDISGAIDNNEVKNSITKTMEGGKIAFINRKRKYGF